MSVCKADWYSDIAELENDERADDDDIELSVSNYSCSSTADVRGFDNAYHHYTLVISARLNAVATRLTRYKQLLQAGRGQCGVSCQLKTMVHNIVNKSRPVIDRLVTVSRSHRRLYFATLRVAANSAAAPAEAVADCR